MEYRDITCREHGGTFSIPVKRGRPPTRCNPENVCDMVAAQRKHRATAVAARTARTLKGEMPKRASESVKTTTRKTVAGVKDVRVQETPKPAPRKSAKASPVVVRHNPSIQVAKLAKDQLEPLGWTCKGRAWFEDSPLDEKPGAWAELTCRRDTELLILRWHDGKAETQDYSLWDVDKTPAGNGRPKSRLPWNPDEMSDSELVNALMGKDIEWWNVTKKGKEKATVSRKQVKVEHTFYDPDMLADEDDENSGPKEPMRIVTFVDPSGGGFRSFHVGALMKVSL